MKCWQKPIAIDPTATYETSRANSHSETVLKEHSFSYPPSPVTGKEGSEIAEKPFDAECVIDGNANDTDWTPLDIGEKTGVSTSASIPDWTQLQFDGGMM
jgi:hypothetical protein